MTAFFAALVWFVFLWAHIIVLTFMVVAVVGMVAGFVLVVRIIFGWRD